MDEVDKRTLKTFGIALAIAVVVIGILWYVASSYEGFRSRGSRSGARSGVQGRQGQQAIRSQGMQQMQANQAQRVRQSQQAPAQQFRRGDGDRHRGDWHRHDRDWNRRRSVPRSSYWYSNLYPSWGSSGPWYNWNWYPQTWWPWNWWGSKSSNCMTYAAQKCAVSAPGDQLCYSEEYNRCMLN